MNLSVKERLLLLNTLPKEGDFITLKIVRKLTNDLSFSENEIKEYKFSPFKDKNEKDLIGWDQEVEQNKEIEIGEKATDIIVDGLKELDKNKKLTNDYFELYSKFIGD